MSYYLAGLVLVFFGGFLRLPWPLCFVMPAVVIGLALIWSGWRVNTESDALGLTAGFVIAIVALIAWWIGYALAPRSLRRR